ncbi:MAG: CPBP family intramembrane glutamic endopeptidase [Pyrinomonadaceae bacterium]
MNAISKYPLLSFVVIAFGWTWPFAALIERSMVFPLLALFGPTIAALVVIYARDGRAGISELAGRFRPSFKSICWYILAALLPLFLLLPQWLLYRWLWGTAAFEMNPISVLSVVIAALIVGEEIGWRGFLLPYLLERYSLLVSSMIVGIIWALWHVPNFLLPAYHHYELPFSAFTITTTAFSILFAWFHMNSTGSLLIALIFHAALNLFSLSGLDPTAQIWSKAAIYTLMALTIIIVAKDIRDRAPVTKH